jgi:hypothetical protein
MIVPPVLYRELSTHLGKQQSTEEAEKPYGSRARVRLYPLRRDAN